MTSPFVDASRGHAHENFCQIKLLTSTMLAAVQADHDGLYLPVFQYIAAVDFVQQFVQTSSAKQVTLNST